MPKKMTNKTLTKKTIDIGVEGEAEEEDGVEGDVGGGEWKKVKLGQVKTFY